MSTSLFRRNARDVQILKKISTIKYRYLNYRDIKDITVFGEDVTWKQ